MTPDRNRHIDDIERDIIENVMSRIAKQRRTRARVAAIIHGSLVICAFAGLLQSLGYTALRAGQSGFFQYLSLISSDWSHLAGAWPSFLMSLAQSAPIIGSILSLALVAVLIYAVQRTARGMSLLRSIGDDRHYQTIRLA